MTFTSIEYLFFLPLVFALYHAARGRRRWQNVILLAASYVFYAWWDVRFLSLLLLSSASSYGCGLLIERLQTKRLRRAVNIVNIVVNVGILAAFKYWNFFIEAFHSLLGTADPVTMFLLPVGISFYTFQAIGYTVDVYQRKSEATHDAVAFFTFMAFFPKLVSGPVERSTTLLPQLLRERRFDYATAVDGCRRALWGLFKKLIIADSCGTVVDMVWDAPGQFSTLSLLSACVLFSFQVYCDLSGYTDIALGTASLFGIQLSPNFKNPYFSRNIPEFWRRWHMSLMRWFRDYIYIPLGGSRRGRARMILNTLIVFLVSGLWHGADWTFICYGLYHGLLCSSYVITGWRRRFDSEPGEGCLLPSWREALMMTATFTLVTLGRILFRAPDMSAAGEFVGGLLHYSGGGIAGITVLPLCALLLVVEWIQRDREHVLQLGGRLWRHRAARWVLYLMMVLIIFFGRQGTSSFIYTQF